MYYMTVRACTFMNNMSANYFNMCAALTSLSITIKAVLHCYFVLLYLGGIQD